MEKLENSFTFQAVNNSNIDDNTFMTVCGENFEEALNEVKRLHLAKSYQLISVTGRRKKGEHLFEFSRKMVDNPGYDNVMYVSVGSKSLSEAKLLAKEMSSDDDLKLNYVSFYYPEDVPYVYNIVAKTTDNRIVCNQVPAQNTDEAISIVREMIPDAVYSVDSITSLIATR